MTTLYGIKNCDTVKKARQWLEQHNIDYRFHDFRADGIDKTQIAQWIDQLGWETLVNKRSTTWKQLDQATRDTLNENTVTEVILDNPTLIKRPLLDIDGHYSVGFKAAEYQERFN